jgi:hypothetical protein
MPHCVIENTFRQASETAVRQPQRRRDRIMKPDLNAPAAMTKAGPYRTLPIQVGMVVGLTVPLVKMLG